MKIIHKKKKTSWESLNFQFLKLFCLNNYLISKIIAINFLLLMAPVQFCKSIKFVIIY